MNFGTYRQYDSRWGAKNYNGSSNYANAGCGATACANILHAIDASITPLTTGRFMQKHKYAIPHNGTAWDGIPACLKAFGAKDVRQVYKMSDVFSLCAKGYVGVFLFSAGTRGGITWTTSGHYIAVTGFKVLGNKHYFKTFDSGGRKHDGFFCYETQMKGLIPRIWLCKIPSKKVKKPTGKYSGVIPQTKIKYGDSGKEVKRLQKFLNWYHADWKLKVDGKCGGLTINALCSFQATEGIEQSGVYGTTTQKKAKAYAKNVSIPTSSSTALPKKCIDVSYWQGKISVENWKKIKKTCGYAICRTSYTSQSKFALSKDSTFATNFKNAQKAGLKVGAYHYSQAITVAEAKREAKFMCEILKGYNVDFYVVCDFEYGGRLNSKIGKKASDIANAFCDVVKSYGYSPCIYANTSTLNNNLTQPKYPVWVAQYNDKCSYKGSKVMWQYTSKGRVDGIEAKHTNNGSANVDLSHVYVVPNNDDSKPTPVYTVYQGAFPNLVKHSGQKLAYVAKALAYPKGTRKSKYTYGIGKATKSFREAIKQVYPNRASWSKQCQEGASCDVGSGTAIRYSGIDTKISRALAKQIPYLANSPLWKATTLKKTSQMKAGDVGIYLNKGEGGHIWICVGDNLIAEANHTSKYFFHIDTDNYTSANKKKFVIYRSTRSTPIQKGDKGTEVKKLQRFLKWLGLYVGEIDGDCGAKTENAIILFQEMNGLKADGIFGNRSLSIAKKIKK